MSDFSLFSPGCCGCGSTVNTCFQVFGCCQKLEGATVEVYECAAPGVTLASGTTDVNGIVCLDLSAHSAKTLCARATYPDDYQTGTISLGLPLVAGYTINLTATSGRSCCDTCWPDTIPDTLCLNDPQGLWTATSSGYGSASCGAGELDVEIDVASCTTFPSLPWCSLTGSACGTPTTGWKYEAPAGGYNGYGTAWTSEATYYMWCDIDSGTMKLTVTHSTKCFCTCCRHSGFVADCADCQEALRDGGTAPTYSGVGATVEATSVTCDPFTATFDIPELDVTISPCPRPCTSPCGTYPIDARTITVTEGPCP